LLCLGSSKSFTAIITSAVDRYADDRTDQGSHIVYKTAHLDNARTVLQLVAVEE
jgi:hypothetical protein